MNKYIALIVLLLLILPMIVGCHSQETTSNLTVSPAQSAVISNASQTPSGPLTLEITGPQDGGETEWGFTTVRGTVSPSNAVVSVENEGYVRVELDGSFESDSIVLNEGKNEIRITAVSGDEEITQTVTVNYNLNLHVSISLDYEPGKDWLTESPVRIGGRVSDPHAGVTINGQKAAVGNDGSILVTFDLKEGVNTLSAVAVLGTHTATDTRDVVYKREGLLSVGLISPWAGTKSKVDYIEVTGTVSDPEADVVIISELFTGIMSGEPVPVFFAPARVKASGEYSGYIRLSEGKNQVWVIAHRGNDRSSADVTVIYDPPLINLSSTPNVKMESPAPDSKYLINLIKVSGTVDEADATMLINGMEAEILADGKFSGYAVLEQTGENTIEVVAFNKSKKSVLEIPVTFEPPLTVSLNAESQPGVDYSREPMTVSGTVNKPGARVTVNGKDVPVNESGFFKTQVILKEGNNRISAVAILGDETDEMYILNFIENGVLGHVPGYSLFFSASLTGESEITLKVGETLRLPMTLETRKDGPGRFYGRFVYVDMEYGNMPLPWPEGLDIYFDPPEFTAYPNATYTFELVVSAAQSFSPGVYYLHSARIFENGFYGSGWIKVTVE